ncbi:MAG: hypothetical protein HPY57_13775 [Ignavibacteria bacterium]|nr:hypothetical protein [Ignavibacteria bacterium]
MISVSLIDYIGKIEDGVAVLLSLMIKDNNYELVYWFNPNNKFRITIEDKFYIDFPKVKNIYEYEYLIDLLYHIDTQLLPPREEIFKEFLT